jgi:hypothetical protein
LSTVRSAGWIITFCAFFGGPHKLTEVATTARAAAADAAYVDLASGDVGVSLTLTSLPRLSPEPSLGAAAGKRRR